MLLTRAPVAGGCIATSPLPLDLHVLSLSLAFILSQDQTLRCFISFQIFTILICLSSKYQNLAAQKSPLIIESSRKPFQSRLSPEKKLTSFVLLSSRCNSFNLLFRLPRCALAVRKLCKGKTKNSFVQILFDFFSNFFFFALNNQACPVVLRTSVPRLRVQR